MSASVFKNSDGVLIVKNLIKTIQNNKDYLSKIDGEIGDGDHGINMNKGFSICEQRISDEDGFDVALEKLGNVLMAEIGGSMGPLYGMFFLSMKDVCKGKDGIDAPVFAAMLQAAYDSVAELGGAKLGDKTLVDTLLPAMHAFNSALSNDTEDFKAALEAMDKAAEDGYLSTKDLVAKLGRSSRLGERSRGVLDAGATSCYLLLHSMKETIIQLIG